MRSILKKYLIILTAVYLIRELNLGLEVNGFLADILFSVLILFILLLIKPFIDVLMLPINLLTLNLSNWFLFIFVIFFWTVITPKVKFIAFNFPGIKFASLTISQMMIPYWLSVILMSFLLILSIKFLTWLLK